MVFFFWALVVLLTTLPSALGFAGALPRSSSIVARSGQPVAMSTTPAALAEAAWLPELQACCAVAAATGPDEAGPEERMGMVLEWLQTMLVNLELQETEEEDELDADFVNAARPWLHTKAFFDVSAQGFAEVVWGHVSAADYLLPAGEGGSLLLLLPSRLPLSLFERVADTVRSEVATHVNADAVVSGCHPDAEQPERKTPVPVVQIFADSPDLLVEGGSMSDAAGFL